MDDELLQTIQAIEVVAAVFGLAVIGLIGWLLTWGLLKAGTLRPSVALIISLSMLTMVALVGFAITQSSGEQSTELATLAGTGLGALAGAVTAVWSDRSVPDVQPPVEPLEPVEQGAVEEPAQPRAEGMAPTLTGEELDEEHTGDQVEDTAGFPEDD